MEHIIEMPARPRALLVLAHGAGAGMRHRFLEGASGALQAVGVGTFRYEFPYMEAGRKRVDTPAAATARVREAVELATKLAPGVPLLAGGKSFGGRMTSQAQAAEALPGVLGLVFLGFPLHPPGRPGTDRADHLSLIEVPMLFLQGTRDEFAQRDLLLLVVRRLGWRAKLHEVEGANHSFAVKGRPAAEVLAELAGVVGEWTAPGGGGPGG